MISVTDDLVQEINKLIYRFVWKGTDQIKRCALARRVLIFKRYVDNKYENPWKGILHYFLSGVGEKFILQCNFDTRKLPIYLPAFCKECLDAWATLHEVSVLSYEDTVNQILWNYKNVSIGKTSIFDKKVMRIGIVTIGDLLSDIGVLLKSVIVLNAKLSLVDFL